MNFAHVFQISRQKESTLETYIRIIYYYTRREEVLFNSINCLFFKSHYLGTSLGLQINLGVFRFSFLLFRFLQLPSLLSFFTFFLPSVFPPSRRLILLVYRNVKMILFPARLEQVHYLRIMPKGNFQPPSVRPGLSPLRTSRHRYRERASMGARKENSNILETI